MMTDIRTCLNEFKQAITDIKTKLSEVQALVPKLDTVELILTTLEEVSADREKKFAPIPPIDSYLEDTSNITETWLEQMGAVRQKNTQVYAFTSKYAIQRLPDNVATNMFQLNVTATLDPKVPLSIPLFPLQFRYQLAKALQFLKVTEADILLYRHRTKA